jgi:hypothetical protein
MNTQPSSAADPICHKEICGVFPKMSWSSLSRPFNNTTRSKRTKHKGNGPPLSIEWTRRSEKALYRSLSEIAI